MSAFLKLGIIYTSLLMLLVTAVFGGEESTELKKNEPIQPLISKKIPPEIFTYMVVNTYPHDPEAFTQGLVFKNGVFYESTGLFGRSSLREVDIETGNVIRSIALPSRYFGEGIVIFKDKIIQLTWRSQVAFVYELDSFKLIGKFNYEGEGWGITHDGERLIMSNGTATLYFRDPETFMEIGRVKVFDNNGPVTMLNELEYIAGEVYANVWQTDRIARIDPETGRVKSWIQLNGLLGPGQNRLANVLNGTAHDKDGDRLFVTGKLWPSLFEIIIHSTRQDFGIVQTPEIPAE